MGSVRKTSGSVFRRIAAFSVHFRWAVLLVWLAAVPLAVFILPSLSSVTTDDNASFLPKSSETHKAAELEKPFRSESVSGSATVVIARNASALTVDDYAYIKALGQKVQAVTNVKVVENRGVSTDGKAVQLYVGVDASPTSKEGERLVGDIRALFSAGRPSGLAVHLTGSFPVVVDASTERNRNVDRTGKFTVVLIVLLLFFVFRSLLAPLLALVPAMVALAIAGPVIGGFSKLGLEVSSVTELLLTVLILGAGTDYGLFFVFRVREQLRSGQKPNEAVMSALEKVGESITFSALTVMAALVSLLLAKFGLYKGLGPGLAIGLAVMLVVSLTFLPALAAVLGRVAFWPSRTKRGVSSTGLWGKIAGKVISRPFTMLVAGTVLFGALSLGLIGYRTTGLNSVSETSSSADSAQGTEVLGAHYKSGGLPQELLFRYDTSIWEHPQDLQVLHEYFSAQPTFNSLTSPLLFGGQRYTAAQLAGLIASPAAPAQLKQALQQFISRDGKTVRLFVTLSAGNSGSVAADETTPIVRGFVAQAQKQTGAVAAGVYSQDAASYDIGHTATNDLKRIMPIVLVVIGILLALMLRSVVAPLYLILTVGLSYIASLGFAMLVFVHTGHSEGLNFILPFIMFIFSMALGEDYNILVMNRIREEAVGKLPLKKAAALTAEIHGVKKNALYKYGLEHH